MQPRKETINVQERNALFENQLTAEHKLIRLQLYYLTSSNLVNLTLSLKLSNLQRQLLQNSQLFYLDPSTRMSQYLGIYPFSDDVFVEVDPKTKEKLQFKFRKMGGPTAPSCQSSPQKITTFNSSSHSRQRTIGEARQYLENRNILYRNPSFKYTLQQVADIVGLPKKTLDDYDRHMRMAEIYGFDFQKNKHMGMGVLRTFVKEQNLKEKPDPPFKQQFMEPGYFLSIGQSTGQLP